VGFTENRRAISDITDVPDVARSKSVCFCVVVPHAVLIDIPAVDQGCPGRHTQRGVGAAPVETYSFRRQVIQIGRANCGISSVSQGVSPLLVWENQDDIGSFSHESIPVEYKK